MIGSQNLKSERRIVGGLARQRIDKWLWHARVVRTRSAAAALASGGYVRVNGIRVTGASTTVRIGDVVTIALDRGVRVLKVRDFAERRGPGSASGILYLELTRDVGLTPDAGGA